MTRSVQAVRIRPQIERNGVVHDLYIGESQMRINWELVFLLVIAVVVGAGATWLVLAIARALGE